jgi:ABC-type spermidine/putrescine transport system permease subunit I
VLGVDVGGNAAQFLGVGDLPFGAMISFVLILLTIISVYLLRRHDRPMEAS